MANQSFAAENFRQIFDYENRRGVYLEAEFFPEIQKLTKDIKTYTANIRDLRKKRDSLLRADYDAQRSKLYEDKRELETKKESLLTKELEKASDEICGGNFRVGLQSVTIPSGKKAYAVDNTPSVYFAMKQLQSNIRSAYAVKQSSRYEIICQLTRILGDRFPKYVVRTDIKDFYETIPREKLLKRIDADAFLTLPTRKIIHEVLSEFERLAGSVTGVPRGIGISAYLAELYMREFDKLVRAREGVIYYARYVDDIVVIFSPEPNSRLDQLLPFIKEQAKALNLALNPEKTDDYDLSSPKKCEFEFLGYRITFGLSRTRVGLGDARMKKYEDRIKRSFDEYKKRAAYQERKARRLLIKRIKFLTGNTRLQNNKGNVMIGTFFSNSLLSDSNELRPLDDALKAEVNSIASASLKHQLNKFSFEEGFSQKRYHPFSTHELSQIVGLWKHEA
jgi:hypothetical protein